MKKYFIVGSVLAIILICGISPASAKDDAFTKFGRGMANIVISPGEFYTQPVMLSDHNATSTALFGGFNKAAALFLSREVVAELEVVTFPFPLPNAGYGPIINPATTFTDWDTRQPQS